MTSDDLEYRLDVIEGQLEDLLDFLSKEFPKGYYRHFLACQEEVNAVTAIRATLPSAMHDPY